MKVSYIYNYFHKDIASLISDYVFSQQQDKKMNVMVNAIEKAKFNKIKFICDFRIKGKLGYFKVLNEETATMISINNQMFLLLKTDTEKYYISNLSNDLRNPNSKEKRIKINNFWYIHLFIIREYNLMSCYINRISFLNIS